ncbi:M1 family metallopeptidase [Halomonas sp. E19]|uniref:M1 family metallopeptidase n=1 Tax=Halomonas sp. E19 TaxID=3397247 RepID=UPI004033FF60
MAGRAWRCLRLAGLLVLLALPGLAAQADPSLPKVELALYLDPAKGRLEGRMTITPPPSSRHFSLLPGLELLGARSGNQALPVRAAGDGRHRLIRAAAGESLTLHWQGRLDRESGMVSPQGSLLPAHGGWYPRFDELGPFSLGLQILVPPGQRAVGTGSLVGEPQAEATGYTVRHVHPRTEWIEVATGPWQERRREVDGVQLRTLFPDALDERHAETYLDHAADYLPRFARRVGPYPFDSFTIAASPAPVGLAFPGFTLLGEQVIPLPFIPRTSLAHELMHAWWGAGVLVDYSGRQRDAGQSGAGGNWSEALTTYLADYALDEARGEARDTRQRWLNDLAALPDGFDRRPIDFRAQRDPALRLLGYQHGAMLLHMLRQRIGDDAFDAGLRRFAEAYMHHPAGWEDLAAALGEAAETPLEEIVAAWTQRPGRPVLAVQAERRATDAGWRLSGTLRQSGGAAPWPLLVPLVVTTAGGEHRERLAFEGEAATFELVLDDEPLALDVDPDFDVLRALSPAPAILRRAALDPASRLLALEPSLAPLAEQAFARPLASHGDAHVEASSPLVVIGETRAVGEWLTAQGLGDAAEALAAAGRARALALRDGTLVALSGDEHDALAQLAGGLRHHLGASQVVLTAEAGLESSTRPPEEPTLRVDFTR